MPLQDIIPMIAPRERTGPRASRGFSFQKDWALCEILRRHDCPEDYLAAFDYQDDFVLVEDPSDTAEMHFFQVKARRSGTYRMSDLLRPQKKKSGDKNLSDLGKLYDAKVKYPANTASLNFVTTVPFTVSLADTSAGASTERTEIAFSDIEGHERARARKSILSEHALAEEPQFEAYTFLRVTELSVLDSQGHAVGKVDQFIEKRAPNRKRYAQPFYRALVTEITRRSDYAEVITSYDDFLKKKALTRDQIESFLAMAGAGVNLDELWTVVENRLNTEAVSITKVRLIRQGWVAYEVDRLAPENQLVSRLRESILTFVSRAGIDQIERLTDLLNLLATDTLVQSERSKLYSDEYVAAAALMEVYERSELPPSYQKSTEEGR